MNFALASYYYAAVVFPFLLISAIKTAEPKPGGNICPMPDSPFYLSPAPYYAASTPAVRSKRFILEAAALIGTAIAAKKVTHFAGKAGKKMGRAIRKGLHGGRSGPSPRMMKRPGRRRGPMKGGRMLSPLAPLGPLGGGPMGRMKGRRMGAAKGRRRGGKGRRKGKRGRNRQKYDPMGMHPLEPLGPMGMQHKSMAHEPSFEPANEMGHAGSKSVENNGQDIEVDDEMMEPYEMGEINGFEEEGEYPMQGGMDHGRMPQGHGQMRGHGPMPQMHGKMLGHGPMPQRHGGMRPPMPSTMHHSQHRSMGQMPSSFPGNAPNHRPNPRPHPMMPHGNNNIHRPNPSIHPVQHESIERHKIVSQNPPMPPQHQIRPPMQIGRNSSSNHPNSFGRRPTMPKRKETVSTSIRSHLPPGHPLSKNHLQSQHPGPQMHSARYHPYAPNRPSHKNGQSMPMHHRPPIAHQMPHNLHNLPQHHQPTHRPNGMNLMGPNRFGHHPPMHNFSRARTPFEHEVDKENVNKDSREKSDETNEVEEHRRETAAAKRIGTTATTLPRSGEGFGANRMPMGLANRIASMRHGTAMPPLNGSGHESDEGKEREDEEDGEHSVLGAGHHMNSRLPTNRHPTNRHPTQMPFPQGFPRNPTQMPGGQFQAHPPNANSHSMEHTKESEERKPTTMGLGTIGAAGGFGQHGMPRHPTQMHGQNQMPASQFPAYPNAGSHAHVDESGEEGEHHGHEPTKGLGTIGSGGGIGTNPNPNGGGLGTIGDSGFGLGSMPHRSATMPNGSDSSKQSVDSRMAKSLESARSTSVEEGDEESGEEGEHGHHRKPTGPPGLGMHSNANGHTEMGIGMHGPHGMHPQLGHHLSQHPNNPSGFGASHGGGLGAHEASSGEPESLETQESKEHPENGQHPGLGMNGPAHPSKGLGTIGMGGGSGGFIGGAAPLPGHLPHPAGQGLGAHLAAAGQESGEEESGEIEEESHHHPNQNHHHPNHPGENGQPPQGLGTIGSIPGIGGVPTFRSSTMPNRLDSQKHPMPQRMANSDEVDQHPGFGHHDHHALGAGPMQERGMHPLHQMMPNGGNGEGDSSEEQHPGMEGGFGAHNPRAASMPAAGIGGFGEGVNPHLMPPNRVATTSPSMGLGGHHGGPIPSAMAMPTNPNGGQMPGGPTTYPNGPLPVKAPMGAFPPQQQQNSPHPFHGLNPPAIPPPTQLIRPQIIPNGHQQPMGFGATNGQPPPLPAAAHPAMQPSILGAHHPLAIMPPQGHFPARPSFHHPEPEIEQGTAQNGGQHEGPWKGGKMGGKGSESVEHSGERHDWRQHGRNASMKDPALLWPRQNVQQQPGGEPAHKLVGKLVNSAQQDLQTAQNKLKTAAELLESPPHLRQQQPQQQPMQMNAQQPNGLPNVPNQMPPNLHIPFNQHGNGRQLPVPPNPMAQHSSLNTGPLNPMAQHSSLNTGPLNPMAQHSSLNTGPPNPMAQHLPPLPHSHHQPNHPLKFAGNAQQNPSLGNPLPNSLPNQSIRTNNPSNHHHGQIHHPQMQPNPPASPMPPTNLMGFPSNPTSSPAIPSPILSQPNQHLNPNLHGILKHNQGGHSLNSKQPASSQSLPPTPLISPISHPMMSSPPSNPIQNGMTPNSSASSPVAPPLNSMFSSPSMHHPLLATSNLPAAAIPHPMMMMPMLNQIKNNAMSPKPSLLANAAIPPFNAMPNQQNQQTPSAMPSPPNPTIMAPKMPSFPSAGMPPPLIPSIPPISSMNSNALPPSIPSSPHQMHHGHRHPNPSPFPSFAPSIPQFAIPPPINPLQKLPFGLNISSPSTNSSLHPSSLPSAPQNGIPSASSHNSGPPNSVQNLPPTNNFPSNPSLNNAQFPPPSLPTQPVVGMHNSALPNSFQQQNFPSASFQHPVEMERRQKPRLAATPNKMPNILQQGAKSPFQQQQRAAPNPASLPHHLNLLRRPIQQQQFPQRPSMPTPMMMRPQAAKRRRRKRK